MLGKFRSLLSLVALTTLSCTPQPSQGQQRPQLETAARHRSGLQAKVLQPTEVPSALLQALLAPAQKTADEASRRRDIDFFTLHANPVGLQLGQGEGAGTVLSFLGTSRDRTNLNIELRALHAAGKTGFAWNYSGPVTMSSRQETLKALDAQRDGGTGIAFELLMGLPGNGVADLYGDTLDRLASHLRQRYGARPFTFDDAPMVFAVHQGAAVAGFLFCNQGNRLILGERKYGDVQNVALFSAEADMLACYTLVGFNEKTAGASPQYKLLQDQEGNLIFEFGDI